MLFFNLQLNALHESMPHTLYGPLHHTHTPVCCLALQAGVCSSATNVDGGLTCRARLVIGADGVRSAVRSTMFPKDPGPRYLVGVPGWTVLGRQTHVQPNTRH